MSLQPFIALVALAVSLAAQAERDDRGVEIALARPASRIVTLTPHLAEVVFAAGAGAKLVGVSSFSRYPEEVRSIPVVASYGRVDLERMLVLKPDLVLGWLSGNSPLQIERLERLGIAVAVTEAHRLSDIPRILRLVGRLAGSPAVAEGKARELERTVEQLQSRYSAQRTVDAFFEFWHQPMLTVNNEHLISDAIRVCGGRNVFSAARTLTAIVSREQILGARPEVILTSVEAGVPAWQDLELVPAVRSGRIYAIDPDLLLGQGPRFVDGTRVLCQRLAEARG